MKTIVTRDIFVRIRFSNFEYQNFTIGLLVVSSFANDSIVFFQKSKFHLIFFNSLLKIYRCERLCETKEEK